MNYEYFENINVVKNEIPYSKIVDYINFVVENSYSKTDGMYYAYLRDYSMTIAILTMYTDCDDDKFGFDDIMAFITTPKWKQIQEELGDLYFSFRFYVNSEIEYRNAPMRSIDKTMQDVTVMVEKINSIVSAIDVESLKNYDYTKVINAIDALDNVNQNNN